MSALKKWALGGLIGCVIGTIVFAWYFFAKTPPPVKFLGILPTIVSILGILGIIVKLPDLLAP
jgi:hypothetical protein